MAKYKFPDGSVYELDLSNPEHKAWMEKKAGAAPSSGGPPAAGGDSFGRQLALTGRAAAKGLASLPGIPVDAVTGVANHFLGTKIPTTVSAVDQFLTSRGIPDAENGVERVVQDAGSAVAGTGGVLGAAGKKGLEALGSAPVMQAIAAALSGGAGSAAKEAGAGPGTQAAASVIAGMSPNVVSAAAVPAGRVVGKLAEPFSQSGRDAVKSRLIRELTGDKIDDVSSALGNAHPRVPGMTYDAALAAEPAGSTEFSALSRVLQKRFNPSGLADLEAGNADARTNVVKKIAGTLADREWQNDLRSSTASMTYGAAYGKKINADPDLAKLAQNPFFKQAWEEARDLSASQKLNPKDNLTKMLQNTKLSLDSMLAGTAKKPIAKHEEREVTNLQKALVQWMEQKNPEYKVAREAFSEQSRPINRMSLGNYLTDKLTAPLDDMERPGVFAQAMRDAPRTIKNSTGNSRYDDIAQVLLPKQVKSLEGVQSELARNRSVQQQASHGQEAVKEVVSSAFAPVEPPSFLHRGITLLRSLMERSQRGTSRKTLQELAGDMQSPEKIRSLLAQFPKEDQPAVMAVLKQIAGGTAMGTATGIAAQE
jgi:hypothetical protein